MQKLAHNYAVLILLECTAWTKTNSNEFSASHYKTHSISATHQFTITLFNKIFIQSRAFGEFAWHVVRKFIKPLRIHTTFYEHTSSNEFNSWDAGVDIPFTAPRLVFNMTLSFGEPFVKVSIFPMTHSHSQCLFSLGWFTVPPDSDLFQKIQPWHVQWEDQLTVCDWKVCTILIGKLAVSWPHLKWI